MKNIYSIFLIGLLGLGCSNNNNQDEMILSVDISSSNQQIVYSVLKEGYFKLYTSDVEGKNLKPLNVQEGYSYLRPKFSKQGEKIIYVLVNERKFENSLAIFDIKSQEQTIVMTTSDEFIGDAIISDDLQNIYFTMAKSYQSNSPIVPRDLKGFDLYELSLLNKEIRSLTAMEAYGMGGLVDFNSDTLMLNIEGSKGGIYHCSKKEANKTEKVNFVNEKGEKPMDLFYTDFCKIDKNIFIVNNNYQITWLSFEGNKVKDIYLSDDQIKCLSYYNNRIYFVTGKDPLVLKVISTGGELKKEIKLKFS